MQSVLCSEVRLDIQLRVANIAFVYFSSPFTMLYEILEGLCPCYQYFRGHSPSLLSMPL